MTFEFKIVKNSSGGITEQDFRTFIEKRNWRPLPDSSSILLIHKEGVPWLVADWHAPNKEPAHVTLNVSWGHYRFPLVWTDAFDLGLNFANSINAELIEDSEKSQVTAKNIDKLLEYEGFYVQQHLKIWSSFRSDLEKSNKAPFEYPLGPIEAVGEFFALRFMPSAAVDLDQVIKRLNLNVTRVDDILAYVNEPGTDKPLVKLLQRTDGYYQFRPFYWHAPFAEVADNTLTLAENMREEFGGDLWFINDLYTNPVREEIRSHINDFAVDFYQWRHKVR